MNIHRLRFSVLCLKTLLLIAFVSFSSKARANSIKIEGTDLTTKSHFQLETPFKDNKNLVIYFLSAKCPCSHSHLPEIRRLAEKYKDLRFLAIHSNADEKADLTEEYFKKNPLPFLVLQDQDLKMADQFKAFKTPHAFVLSAQGETLYQGGVTSSSKADEADEMYLDEVLEDITAGKKPRRSEGRTLGCVIMRE